MYCRCIGPGGVSGCVRVKAWACIPVCLQGWVGWLFLKWAFPKMGATTFYTANRIPLTRDPQKGGASMFGSPQMPLARTSAVSIVSEEAEEEAAAMEQAQVGQGCLRDGADGVPCMTRV